MLLDLGCVATLFSGKLLTCVCDVCCLPCASSYVGQGRIPREIMQEVLSTVADDCTAALQQYPTTLTDDDRALTLASASTGSGYEPNMQSAHCERTISGGGGNDVACLRLLAGEKAILHRTAHALQSLWTALGDAAAAQGSGDSSSGATPS